MSEYKELRQLVFSTCVSTSAPARQLEQLQSQLEASEKIAGELAEALNSIMNCGVYSYLPRKEGVTIKMSFEELENARQAYNQHKEGI